MDRIKGLRQKQSDSSYNSLIPFGTDGVLVDMLSGLDNEQEIKLGGNHTSVITEVNATTTSIVETYKALDNTTVTYVVETTIVENNDSSSVTSIQNRGRRIVSRETDPSFAGAIGQTTLDEYAKKRLEELTKVKFSVTYTHGYFPLKVDEGVELDYSQSGMKYKTALITNQTIECKTGCTVSETAIFEERV